MEGTIDFNMNLNLENQEPTIISESTLDELLVEALEKKASDVHLTVALPPMMRINGKLQAMRAFVLMPDSTEKTLFGHVEPKTAQGI